MSNKPDLSPDRNLDRRIARVAALQAGVVATKQLDPDLRTTDLLLDRTRSGRLHHPYESVWIVAGSPDTAERRLWAAYLALEPPAIVGFEGAAFRSDLVGFGEETISFIVPKGDHHRVRGISIHQVDDAFRFAHHLTTVRGLDIPMTTVARTIVDLCAVPELRARARAALVSAVYAQKTTDREIGGVLRDVARRGKPGVTYLTKVLDDRRGKEERNRSHLERAYWDLLDAHGEPRPAAQVPFPGRVLPNCVTDGQDHDEMLIHEVDGRTWHNRLKQVEVDHHRDNEATRAGYATLRINHEDIKGDPDGTILLVRETRAIRRRQLGLAA